MTKIIFTALLIIIGHSVPAQQKNITQGYIELNLKYIAEMPEDGPPPPPPPPPPGLTMPVQENFPGEPDDGFIVKIWFNPSFEKVVNTLYGKKTFLFNTQTRSTISLHEISGLKMGTVATPEDEKAIKKYMDSLEGRKNEPELSVRVEYKNDSSIINGFNCKKALLITKVQPTKADTAIVWYYPGYSLPDHFIFTSDKLAHRQKLAKLKLIHGLPVRAIIPLTAKLKLEMELKKIDINKVVADKEFEVSKDFELKSIKESYGIK